MGIDVWIGDFENEEPVEMYSENAPAFYSTGNRASFSGELFFQMIGKKSLAPEVIPLIPKEYLEQFVSEDRRFSRLYMFFQIFTPVNPEDAEKPQPLEEWHLGMLSFLKRQFEQRYPNAANWDKTPYGDRGLLCETQRFFEWLEFWVEHTLKNCKHPKIQF